MRAVQPQHKFPHGWRWQAWRLQERLQRRQASELYRQLSESQYWPGERLHTLAAQRLEQLLQFATEHVPHYRGLEPRLSGFPLLSRRELRASFAALKSAAQRYPQWTMHSSGSTGQRVSVLRDAPMQDMSTACAWRGDGWGAGLDPQARQLSLWGDPREYGAKPTLRNRLAHFYRNRYLVSAFMLNASQARAIHRTLWTLRPALLTGYPTSILAFVRFARELGLKPPPLKQVLPIAEGCDAADTAELQDFFSAPVLQRYGSHELGCIAHQCERGNWHLHCEHVWLEVLRADGRIAASGTGALVCTGLSNYSQPLIRYEIGDYAELPAGSAACSCGRGLPTFSGLEGRSGQFVYTPDGRWITSHGFLAPLRYFGVDDFRLMQDEPGRVRLLITGTRLETPAEQALREQYAELHSGTLRVDLEYVNEIPPLPNGKRCRVLCSLPRPANLVVT